MGSFNFPKMGSRPVANALKEGKYFQALRENDQTTQLALNAAETSTFCGA
jgi:hypothetical protein